VKIAENNSFLLQLIKGRDKKMFSAKRSTQSVDRILKLNLENASKISFKKKEKRKILVPCPTITGEGRIT